MVEVVEDRTQDSQVPVDIGDILRWLNDQGLLAMPVLTVVSGLKERVEAAGIPVLRLNISTTTLHPQFAAFSIICERGQTPEFQQHEHRDAGGRNEFDASPMSQILVEAAAAVGSLTPEERAKTDPLFTLRFRLDRGEGLDRYEVLRDFQKRGATDYFIVAVAYGWGEMPELIENGLLATWACDRPGGFTDAEIEAVTTLTRALAHAVRTSTLLEIGDTILRTYLGGDAGTRVLRGAVKRGESQTIAAAILISDLRGFTALSDTVPRDALVGMLDDYLQCMADSVQECGGQVLKYLGDGLLATFPCPEENPSAGCDAAIEAARTMQDRTDVLNRTRTAAGHPTMPLDVALHRGEVHYGNVGSDRRMEFTVIGPAVNEAARIESMCEPLGHAIVASKSFAGASDAPDQFIPLGRHELRGVREHKELFALRPGVAGPDRST